MDNHNQEQVRNPYKVSNRLTKTMTPEEATAFVSSYMRAKKVLKRLNEIATKEMNKSMLALDNPSNFDTNNWQYMIAWQGGYRTAMRIMEETTRTK